MEWRALTRRCTRRRVCRSHAPTAVGAKTMVRSQVAGATTIGTTGHRKRPRGNSVRYVGQRETTLQRNCHKPHLGATQPQIPRTRPSVRIGSAASFPPRLTCAHADRPGPSGCFVPDAPHHGVLARTGSKSRSRCEVSNRRHRGFTTFRGGDFGSRRAGDAARHP